MSRRHLLRSLAQHLDQRGQRRRLLPPTWVIEEEAGKRLAPRLQNAHERSTFEVGRRAIFSNIGQANTVERGPNDQFNIVDDQRPRATTSETQPHQSLRPSCRSWRWW